MMVARVQTHGMQRTNEGGNMSNSTRREAWVKNLTQPSQWAVRLYRISHNAHARGHRVLPLAIDALSRIVIGVEIEHTAVVGANFSLRHGLGTVIGQNSVLGDGCVVHQNVTIGLRRLTDENHAGSMPRIGDRVCIYAGAVVAGPITIGNDAIIGANAVVLEDVPAGATVVGAKARIILRRTSVED